MGRNKDGNGKGVGSEWKGSGKINRTVSGKVIGKVSEKVNWKRVEREWGRVEGIGKVNWKIVGRERGRVGRDWEGQWEIQWESKWEGE